MLSEVIAMAGGFTSDASLAGAHINRASDPAQYRTKPLLADKIAGMANSSLNLEDSTRFKFDNELQQNRVSVDFIELFAKGDKSKDVVLQNGDEIVIPKDPGGVYVYGRVNHPGWVAYKSGADNEQYITAAGGYTEAANPGRVIVEKYGTGVWENVCCTQINSGDKIYVPGDRDTPARTSLETASTVAFLASALVSIIVTILTFIRDSNK
jgi:protein involved in polysaccharide export with SLBB domain